MAAYPPGELFSEGSYLFLTKYRFRQIPDLIQVCFWLL